MKKTRFLLPLTISTIATAIAPISIASCSQTNELDQIIEKLLTCTDIKSVQVIKGAEGFKHKFIIYMEQPLDWTNKETSKKFNQRIEFGFNGFNSINTMLIPGYHLRENAFTKDPNNEFVKRYNSNFFRIEYRFFGQSKPIGSYTPKSSEYWKHLTIENAINDFHHIKEVLTSIFTNKWIITGGSKGGQTVDTYAMKYPNDATAFVSFVGPRCFKNQPSSASAHDESDAMLQWLFNKVGDDSKLGKETAEANRFEIFKFINYLLSDDVVTSLATDFYTTFDKKYRLNDYVKSHHKALYYLGTMDNIINFWQAGMDVEQFRTINNMTDSNKKLAAAREFIMNNGDTGDFDINGDYYPYNVQGWKEMGLYNLNPQMFIDKTKEYNNEGANLPVPTFTGIDVGDYSTFKYKCILDPSLMTEVQFDDTIKNQLEAWTANNAANVIMMFGQKDAWTAYKWPTITSSKIHLYMNDNNHNSKINNLDEPQKTECWNLIDNWLK